MRTAAPLVSVVLLAATACSRPAPPPEPPQPPPPAEPRPAAAAPGPVVRVIASYPGANAQTVADTVAAPIEQQVNGVEGAVSLESESRHDGSYTLVVRFKPGTDVNVATVLVQNRVNIAAPQLPDEARRLGVTTDRTDPDRLPLYWVAVTGPDTAVVGGLAELLVRHQLLGVPGVTAARFVGAPTSVARVWLNPEKLAARNLTTQDVVVALEKQRLLAGAGGDFRLEVSGDTPADLEALRDAVLAERGGGKVYLYDVAHVELGERTGGSALAGGKPCALVAVTADAGDATAGAIRKALAGLAPQLPEGVRAELAADLTTGGFGFVELRGPDGADFTRTREVVDRAVKLLGAAECVAFVERRPSVPTILVKPGKEPVSPADLRKALAGIKDAAVRVSDFAAGRPFPVRIAVADTAGQGYEQLRAAGDAVAERLKKDGIALDVDVHPGRATPQLSVRIDREKMAALGVSARDVTAALEANLGAVVNDLVGLDARSVVVGVEARARNTPEAIKELQLRGAEGRVVRLGAIAEVKEEKAPPAVLRVNLQPAVRITAAVPPGKTVAEVTAACVKAAEAEVPKGFKVFDLPR